LTFLKSNCIQNSIGSRRVGLLPTGKFLNDLVQKNIAKTFPTRVKEDVAITTNNNLIEKPENFRWNPELNLYPWQTRALDKWSESTYRGVVEAVTGSGKTHVAIAAMESFLRNGWKVLVLVHTKELQQQWFISVRNRLNGGLYNNYRIGRLGNDFDDKLINKDILIAIAASAKNFTLLPKDQKGLIVVDECHHYGAETWQRCLDERFAARLGLTATYERDDNQMEELDRFFEKTVYKLGFKEASIDGVIAPFKIAFLGVDFTIKERTSYEAENQICKDLFGKLINDYKIEKEPYSEFMKQVNRLADSDDYYGSIVAGKYRAAVNRRKDIVANASNKMAAIKLLKATVKKSKKTIAFTQTIEAARNASIKFNNLGLSSISIDSEMNYKERKEVMEAYRRGRYRVITAPKILDEGVDVPEADVAVVIAASRSRRQMIQRMGRVLRKKKDNKEAKVVIVYVKGTAEDPKLGAHETFIDMIIDVATEIQYFDSRNTATQISNYLNSNNMSLK
jgi:RNA polymerase primary sigma factor